MVGSFLVNILEDQAFLLQFTAALTTSDFLLIFKKVGSSGSIKEWLERGEHFIWIYCNYRQFEVVHQIENQSLKQVNLC